MNIIITTTDTGEVFDVPQGFVLEVKNTSPLFNTLGSKTITTSLPRTDRNKRILGFADRPDIKAKPRTRIPVSVASGSYIRQGVLFLSSAYNTASTFGITVAFNEGIMYADMQNLSLTALTTLPLIEKTDGEMIDYMNYLFKNDDLTQPLSVFTVVLKENKGTATATNPDTGQTDETEQAYSVFLNSKDETDGAPIQLYVKQRTNIIYNGRIEEVSVPAGYGITPFVKVWVVLEAIFAHFGYTVGSNPFKERFQLNRLVLLNNVVDAIVLNRIDCRQLVPDVSVSDFLQSLTTRFGLKVFFDGNANRVDLVLIDDIFTQVAINARPVDFSSLIDIDYTAPRQLKLSVGRSLDRSATETETFEEFLDRYNNTVSVVTKLNYIWLDPAGVWYDPFKGLFFLSSIRNNLKLISSIQFDWNKKSEGLETEELKSIDESLTMFNIETIYYGIDAQLRNSNLSVSTGNPNDQQPMPEMSTPNKLAFAYDMGELYFINDGQKIYQGYNHGSIFPMIKEFLSAQEKWLSVRKEDRQGHVFNYALTLVGEDGAFNRFFRGYDAFLRHSNNVFKAELHAPVFRLSELSARQPVIADNQPLLIDKLDYTLGAGKQGIAKLEARTMRLYAPYDLETEQQIPVPSPIAYRWILNTNRYMVIQDGIPAAMAADREDMYIWLAANYPGGYTSLTASELTDQRQDPDPPENKDFWLLPPTAEEYQNNINTPWSYHPLKIFIYYEWIDVAGAAWRNTTREVTIRYNGWFTPAPL